MPVVTDNTPELFETRMTDALAWVGSRQVPQYVTVNAWNEWTEGSVLEPDTYWGTSKLDALAKAAKSR